MNAPIALEISGLLDASAVRIRRAPSRDTVWDLAQALAAHRRSSTAAEWRNFCVRTSTHPIVDVMLEDPYTRDARLKPAGYAGDARTLDYVYLRTPGEQAISDFGRQLFHVTTGVPIAEAVRERAVVFAREIDRQASGGVPVTVASIACGHLRELDHVCAETRPHLDVWGIDQDARSVGRCSADHPEIRVSAAVGTVRDLLLGRARIPESSFVYASGLFDYLDDRASALLIKRMVAALRPGGTALIANLTPANDEIAYMEAVMDWWMHYRTIADLARLAEEADVSHCDVDLDLTESDDERLAWLRVTLRRS